MNWWILGIVIGLIVIAGLIVAVTGYVSADKVVSGGCQSCNGQCSANGCGNSACGAATGGSCNCGK